MNDDRLWAWIDAHRVATADLLADLRDSEWQQPSLCEGWSVRDVAAHLTLQQLRFPDILGMLFRYGADLNKVIHRSSKAKAAATTDEQVVAEIRAMVGSRRHNVGVTSTETLIDILVHSQDIARPLGV